MLRDMADTGTSLTIPTKRGKRRQMDGEKLELLEMIRAAPDVPHDYHPLVELARLAVSQRLPVNLRIKAHSELALYIVPKRRTEDATSGEAAEVPALDLTRTVDSLDEHKRITGKDTVEGECS